MTLPTPLGRSEDDHGEPLKAERIHEKLQRQPAPPEQEPPMTTPSGMPGPSTPGPYPQPGPYGQPPQPQKKRRTWLIVLLVILALMLIGIVGCVALIGTAGKAVDEAVTEVSASQEASEQAEEDRNAPREVTPGKAFTIGSHKVLDGWNVKADSSLGDAEFQVTGKAKNVSEATSTMFIHIKFISKSGEVLGNVDCSTGDLEPGQTERMNCLSDGQYTSKCDKVTAEADF
jgi:hypothetical protein